MVEPEEVANVIWTAATDETTRLRYISCDGAAVLGNRYLAEQDEAFVSGLHQQFGLQPQTTRSHLLPSATTSAPQPSTGVPRAVWVISALGTCFRS